MIWLLTYIAASAFLAFHARHWWAPLQRLNDVNWMSWVLLDIAIAFAATSVLHLPGLYPTRPDPRETISSIIGRHVLLGKRWASIAAKPIDWIFFVLTSQRDHCAKEAHKHGGV